MLHNSATPLDNLTGKAVTRGVSASPRRARMKLFIPLMTSPAGFEPWAWTMRSKAEPNPRRRRQEEAEG